MKTLQNSAALAALAAAAAAPVPAASVELITNGSFSAGFAGWSRADANAAGTVDAGFYLAAPGALTPVNGFETAGNASGAFAVTDSNGPGAHVLYQLFTALAGPARYTLGFDLFVNDQSGFGAPGTTLAGEQYGRVDLLRPGAAPFSTSAADVIATFYNGVDTGTSPNPFVRYSFDITSFVVPGMSYLLRFGEVDSAGGPVNFGVDNVALVVPIPATAWLVGAGALAAIGARRRRPVGAHRPARTVARGSAADLAS